jgi:hypothetical protein
MIRKRLVVGPLFLFLNMTFEEFKNSLENEKPPLNSSAELQAMWYDGKGDWEMSHNIAQDLPTNNGSWIHAYLHRKEGDLGNASYWYSRANKKMPSMPLDEEWKEIVRAFL